MRKLTLLAVTCLSLAACRGGDDGDDSPNPDSSVTSDDVTIQEIQNDAMTAGTPVNLKGVIVTAIDNYGMRKGDFWVQEPGGGPFSGVQVFGAPLDQVAALTVGDVVDISGAQKEEFALSSDTSGNTLTELEPISGGMLTVTKVSSGTAPTPDVVDALAIGQMPDFMARHAEWEKWEGVPVKLNNVAALSSDECITSMGTCNDMTYSRFDITGDIQAQTGLAALPANGVDRGDCFSSITGIVTYFFDYQINPRTADEFATGGTSCPTENQSAVCGDNIDNDGNGFTDCNDNACVVAEATCRDVSTIAAIQTATTPPTRAVEIQNAYVAAISFNKRNMWIQTNLQAATTQGIYVRGPGDDLTTFAVGSRVTVIGTALEFNDMTNTETLTQIQAYSIVAGTGGAGTVVPLINQMASNLKMAVPGEAAESVLVQLANVKVTTLGTSPNYITTLTQAGGTTFKADDDIYRFATADLNDCYTSITGVWSYNVFENDWVFLPRAASPATTPATPDAVVAGNATVCN